MKKYFLSFLGVLILLFPAATKAQALNERLSGKILLQVEQRGEAWYVLPGTAERYYLKNGDEAYKLMRYKSLGITDANLAKIPAAPDSPSPLIPLPPVARENKTLVNRLKGKILLQVQQHGEAWYVNPDDGLRYYLKDGDTAYEMMRNFGMGIRNSDLRKIPMNGEQVVFDHTFNQVAHVKYSENVFSRRFNSDHILPLASLTKLMTALVILDHNPDWEKEIIITQEDIVYPRQYVDPGDVTSEIDLKTGDIVSFKDLWKALLVASSNQAAGILAKNCQMSFEDFVKEMNLKASSLGLKKTIFTEPSGLDPFNISTAEEMTIIAEEAFGKPEIYNTTIYNFDITAKQQDNTYRMVTVTNRNYSLLNFGVDAAKTGFLYEAQRNAVIKKSSDIIVVMHARSMKERNWIIEKLLK